MENYMKYKWFYTSSGKLVVGGKSAKQNDELLESLDEEYYIMHTSHPGSPFSVIPSDIKKVTKKDLEECAIFTGCFSRAWKEGKKSTEVDIFKTSQITKRKGMKVGTWSVKGDVEKIKVSLKLVLAKQKNVLRAVPENSVKKKDIILKVCPGKTDKNDMIVEIRGKIKNKKISQEELIAALPAGGVMVCK